MKQLIIYLSIFAITISCNNNKVKEDSTIVEKSKDSTSVTIPELSFEEQLAVKLRLPDKLSMAAYRTSGCFTGISNLKDSVYVVIDVEAHKVTGFIKKNQAGKASPENVFEGKLVNNIITTIRGMQSPATFTISGNKLVLKSAKDSAVLNLGNCK